MNAIRYGRNKPFGNNFMYLILQGVIGTIIPAILSERSDSILRLTEFEGLYILDGASMGPISRPGNTCYRVYLTNYKSAGRSPPALNPIIKIIINQPARSVQAGVPFLPKQPLILQIRIGLPFIPNRSNRPMPAVNLYIIGQRHHYFAKRFKQNFTARTWQVEPAHATPKKHITAKYGLPRFVIK